MPTPSRQLLSRTIYETDGVTTDWEFAFSGGYLSTDHIKASVATDGINTTITVVPGMLTNAFTLRIVPALAAGQLLTIFRNTPKDRPLVDFTDEAGFTEIALDTNAKQAIFAAAEAFDDVSTVSTGDVSAVAEEARQAAAQAEAAAASAAADSQAINTILNGLSGYTLAVRASGTGAQTVFPLVAPAGNLSLTVYIGGIYQQRNTWAYSANTVTFTSAPVAGTDNIEFVLNVAQPIAEVADLVVQAQAAATTAGTQASAAAASALQAEDLLDTFEDIYLGAKPTEPVTDNDGNPLALGALYWNSTTGIMRVYNGIAFVNVATVASTVTANQISDSTTVGRSVITAADAAAARTAIGAGTGSGDVLIGTAQTLTAPKRGTVTTDNDLSFDLNVTNNFACTTSGSGTLTFTNITAGQSGFILLTNASNHTISAAATTKVSSTLLTRISASGVYLLSYFSNGTNVYVVASEAFA